MDILARAKGTDINHHGLTERGGKALGWESQGLTVEDVGLEEWVEMVGKILHNKVREQGVMFSFGLSTEC